MVQKSASFKIRAKFHADFQEKSCCVRKSRIFNKDMSSRILSYIQNFNLTTYVFIMFFLPIYANFTFKIRH